MYVFEVVGSVSENLRGKKTSHPKILHSIHVKKCASTSKQNDVHIADCWDQEGSITKGVMNILSI